MPTLLYETLYGSRAFGLAREGSDEDVRGIIVGPRSWYFGMFAAPEQVELGKDHMRYELRKFLRLIEAANPAAIEMLFTDASDHRVVTPAGLRLLEARESFLTSKVAETFGRYATGQLRRIETHRRWLLHPPSCEPTRADFGLPNRTLVPRDQLGAAETLRARGALEDSELSPAFLATLAAEKRYQSARGEWEQYRKWLATRNPARAALEAQHGYDTKHALHLVRMLRMGREILETGKVIVRRPDRDELLAIRDGALSYQALIALGDSLQAELEAARAHTMLPAKVDVAVLDSLCVSLIEEVLRC